MPVLTMINHILAADGINSISDAISQFTTIFSTVWSFITTNWYFSALIFIPLGGLIVSMVIGFIKRS